MNSNFELALGALGYLNPALNNSALVLNLQASFLFFYLVRSFYFLISVFPLEFSFYENFAALFLHPIFVR